MLKQKRKRIGKSLKIIKKMENTNQAIIDKLNHLIGIAQDGRQGYENAAADVDDLDSSELFMKFSKQREVYVNELQIEVKKMGGEAEQEGGPVGTLHLMWMDMKSAFTSGGKTAIINACITGEETAKAEYQKVLIDDHIRGNIKQIIEDQLHGIEYALASIKLQIL